MNIGKLIESYDSLVKQAFIPNPQAQQQQPDPSQAGGQPQGGDQLQQAYAQLEQVIQQLPPEAQQQVAPMLQQLQQLPPDQQLQQISQLTQQLSGQGGEAAQADPSQAAAGAPSEGEAPKEEGHHNAENSLDNTKVTLSVRELLDLSSGGKATQSLLKVKQMADAHNKKMESAQQQQEQQAAEAQQAGQQQAAMGQGGIYPTPMDGSAPAGQQ